jgi:CheY-like chemotaxis protein
MKKVLIVGDNINDRAVLTYYVSKYFVCDIYTASNSRDALERIELISPDVIITDLSMPEMNGMEFIRELSSRNSQIPVVALSALNENAVFEELRHSGILTCLQKPVNSFRFYESLEGIFNFRTAS